MWYDRMVGGESRICESVGRTSDKEENLAGVVKWRVGWVVVKGGMSITLVEESQKHSDAEEEHGGREIIQ